MGSLGSPSTETKITDLNYDCLEKVFRLLSLDDLLNVADCNNHLRIAAESTYSYKYGKKKLRIIYPWRPMKEDAIRKFGNLEPVSITIGYWKKCHKILRCFKHFMRKVELMEAWMDLRNMP